MYREIIINCHTFENRVAVKEDNHLVEYIVEKPHQQYLVGNIYKGIVKNVLPAMGAAFVDIGLSRTAFIHYNDLITGYFDDEENEIKPERLKYHDRDSSNIRKYLKVGQQIVIQIKKSPFGNKGARVIGKISIPGKFLVLIPNSNKISFSKKISSRKDRRQIREILSEIKDDNTGLIVRTEALERTKEDFIYEYNLLKKIDNLIKKEILKAKAPSCIFNQNEFANVLIRDIFRDNTTRLVIDDKKMRDDILRKLKTLSPKLIKVVELYKGKTPIFNTFGIESEINKIFNRRVDLASGGNIVIDQTEAMSVIDINTGSFTGSENYENTIKRVNIEAASEAGRQIRLRNLSGLIVIDFIDMKEDKSRLEVINTIKSALKNDRSKSMIYPFSPLGLVEISRRRLRKSILQTATKVCPFCSGLGRLLSEDNFAMKTKRAIKKMQYFLKPEDITLVVHPTIKVWIDEIEDFFFDIKNKIDVVGDDYIARDRFRLFYTKSKKQIKI